MCYLHLRFERNLFKHKKDINDYIVESDKWDNYCVVLSTATENDNMHSYARALFTAELEPATLSLCLCLDFFCFSHYSLCIRLSVPVQSIAWKFSSQK